MQAKCILRLIGPLAILDGAGAAVYVGSAVICSSVDWAGSMLEPLKATACCNPAFGYDCGRASIDAVATSVDGGEVTVDTDASCY